MSFKETGIYFSPLFFGNIVAAEIIELLPEQFALFIKCIRAKMKKVSITDDLFQFIRRVLRHTGGIDTTDDLTPCIIANSMLIHEISGQSYAQRFMVFGITAGIAGIMKPGSQQ